jgi:hypothetical protein
MATLSLRQPLLHRVSWGALFAGFFFGLGIFMLLLALGAGIGLAAFDPRDMQSLQGVGVGFGIWGVIAGIIAAFLGSWLAARLSASDTRLAGMLHGGALWGFTLIAGVWIATMAVARTAATAAEAAGGAAQAAGQAAGGAASDPRARRDMEQQAREAQGKVENLAQQAQAKAPEAADAAKKAGTAGSWAFFLYGLLTLAASMLGGRAGVPEERVVTGATEPLPAHTPSPQRA